MTEPVFLFDVDGVLIDSGAAHRRVWAAWADARGLDPGSVWGATQGRRRVDTLRLVAPHLDPAEEHALLNRLMAAEEHTVRAYDGAGEVLRGLAAGAWAVVTSSRGEATRRRLAASGLPVPAVRVCAEDVTEGKPSPEGYLTAATRLGADPRHCLVVEDSPAGVAAGRAAGCTVHAVTTTHPAGQLARAHAVFPSLRAAVRAATGHG
ncbi:HAD-IA family hydrolase [Streptomyces sp. NPDC049881]|uniref:HAD-IA family hydrolase n=1 Tax=Streptomyces sp. NPDC049881 TaxID=3155778 RepID=UPI003416AF3C